METADSSPPADISTAAVRLPLFWAEWPAMWFTEAKAQFTLAGISSENSKFSYIISLLDYQYTIEVEDIITLGSPIWLSPCYRNQHPTAT
jgi:hypothetical protein